jgi:hypothetical protein
MTAGMRLENHYGVRLRIRPETHRVKLDPEPPKSEKTTPPATPGTRRKSTAKTAEATAETPDFGSPAAAEYTLNLINRLDKNDQRL